MALLSKFEVRVPAESDHNGGTSDISENVWTVDGPPVHFIGIPFPTRMAIVRLADGSLWVNSPISTNAETIREIENLGPINYLVAPTKLHVWRLEEWHARFPQAELWGAPQIPAKFRKFPFAGTLGDTPPKQWANDLDQLVFRGNPLIQEVFFYHKLSRTVILADFIQNHRIEPGSPMHNVLVRLDGIAYPHGGVPRDIRLSFTKRELARRSLERLLSWDFDNLIIAHGVCVFGNAKRYVEEAFRWLGSSRMTTARQ